MSMHSIQRFFGPLSNFTKKPNLEKLEKLEHKKIIDDYYSKVGDKAKTMALDHRNFFSKFCFKLKNFFSNLCSGDYDIQKSREELITEERGELVRNLFVWTSPILKNTKLRSECKLIDKGNIKIIAREVNEGGGQGKSIRIEAQSFKHRGISRIPNGDPVIVLALPENNFKDFAITIKLLFEDQTGVKDGFYFNSNDTNKRSNKDDSFKNQKRYSFHLDQYLESRKSPKEEVIDNFKKSCKKEGFENIEHDAFVVKMIQSFQANYSLEKAYTNRKNAQFLLTYAPDKLASRLESNLQSNLESNSTQLGVSSLSLQNDQEKEKHLKMARIFIQELNNKITTLETLKKIEKQQTYNR